MGGPIMSVETPDRSETDTRSYANDEQRIVVVEIDGASAIVALDRDADPDEVVDLVDAITTKVATTASGVRPKQSTTIDRVDP